MAREIAARLQSESGWTVVCYGRSDDGDLRFTTHPVQGWGLEGFPSPGRPEVKVCAVPLSLSGEVLSDRPNFVGVVGPNEDLELRIREFAEALEEPEKPRRPVSPASLAVISP